MKNLCWVKVNERGSVINMALLILLILSLIGITAMSITHTELRIAQNLKIGKEVLAAANAGVEEAKLRLAGGSTDSNYAGDPASSPDPLWSAYISSSADWQTSDDPNYDASYSNYFPVPDGSKTATAVTANSLQSDLSYFVKIRHKREYDAEQAGHSLSTAHYYDDDASTATHTSASPGNIIYYGYGNPGTPTTATQFTTAGSTEYWPVEIITAYGMSNDVQSVLQVEMSHHPGPKVVAAAYAKGDITGSGGSLVVDGTDNCGSVAAKPPFYTKEPSVTILNGTPTLYGNPDTPQSGTLDIDIAGYVASMRSTATMLITEDKETTGATIGSASDYVICYSDTSDPYNVGGLKVSNTTGYGTLLVEGDLTLGGNFSWNGLIVVTGTLVFKGGGSGINILGTVLAEQTTDIDGGIDIRYDSCMVDRAITSLPATLLNWQEL